MTYSRLFLYKKRLYHILLLFSAILFLWGGCSNKKPAADTILTNARVYTVNSSKPWAEAVAVRNARILFVGSGKDILRYRGPDSKVIDAGGRFLLPGIEDSHVHFVSGSESLAKVDLSGTRTVEEVQERIRKFAAEHPQAAWVQGRGWMYAAFPGNMPHKKFLDDVVPDRPAVMRCADGHTTWVNSRALSLAGIGRDTKDPENGKIVREENGEPTGALLEAAGSLVSRVIPKPSPEETLFCLHHGRSLRHAQGERRRLHRGRQARRPHPALTEHF